MKEYKFDVDLVAHARVRAPNETLARKVVPSVVTAPSEAEINLINENHAAVGWEAVVTDVRFSLEKDAR